MNNIIFSDQKLVLLIFNNVNLKLKKKQISKLGVFRRCDGNTGVRGEVSSMALYSRVSFVNTTLIISVQVKYKEL